jgi:hypothetical protein
LADAAKAKQKPAIFCLSTNTKINKQKKKSWEAGMTNQLPAALPSEDSFV